jgi:hypothetical protein
MKHTSGKAGIPTILAEIISIYKIKIVCCATIVVGTIGYIPALHTKGKY